MLRWRDRDQRLEAGASWIELDVRLCMGVRWTEDSPFLHLLHRICPVWHRKRQRERSKKREAAERDSG
jgi:hypothetical protein